MYRRPALFIYNTYIYNNGNFKKGSKTFTCSAKDCYYVVHLQTTIPAIKLTTCNVVMIITNSITNPSINAYWVPNWKQIKRYVSTRSNFDFTITIINNYKLTMTFTLSAIVCYKRLNTTIPFVKLTTRKVVLIITNSITNPSNIANWKQDWKYLSTRSI